MRDKIGTECRWRCPGDDKVISAAHIIERIAQQLTPFTKTQRVACNVPVDLGPELQPEYFTFTVKEEQRMFKVNRSDRISALSLWIFYSKEGEKQRESDEPSESGLAIFFLGQRQSVALIKELGKNDRDIHRVSYIRSPLDEPRDPYISLNSQPQQLKPKES